MVSDVTLAESESIYRELADQRKSAELEQQSSRWRLAIALNRPDDIPGELIRPDLPQLDRNVPELSELLGEAFNNNLTLTALEHAMLADRAALKATQQQYGPTLAAGLELNEYQRKLPGKNDASIGVTLRIPLLNGSRSQAEVARAAAKLSSSQANYDLAKYTLRQNLSDLVRRLELLIYKRTTDELRLDSTSLTLDRNRARYELEMQTTLGDSMAKYTNAEWLSAKNDFEIATTWAQIEILTGKKLYQNQE
jgi:outer membrane protein TolC